jgi:hypothetical protein
MQDVNACRTPMDGKLQVQAAALIDEPCTIEPYASLLGDLMLRAPIASLRVQKLHRRCM